MEILVVMVETLVLTTLVVAVEQVVLVDKHILLSNAAGGHGGEGIQMPGFEYPLIGLLMNQRIGQILHLITIMVVVDLDGDINYNPIQDVGGGGVGNNGAPNAYQVPGINGLGGGGGGNSGDGGSGIVVFRYQYE